MNKFLTSVKELTSAITICQFDWVWDETCHTLAFAELGWSEISFLIYDGRPIIGVDFRCPRVWFGPFYHTFF